MDLGLLVFFPLLNWVKKLCLFFMDLKLCMILFQKHCNCCVPGAPPAARRWLGTGLADFPWDMLTFWGPVSQGWCCLATMHLSKSCSSGAREHGRAGWRQGGS